MGAERPKVSRNVAAMGVVSLLTDASSEMVYWVLPLFLTQVLHAPVSVVGVIESIAEATASLLKAVSGRVSDIVGRRRPLVVLGYSLSNVMKPLLALTASWPAVLALRFADRFGKGVRTAPRDALIADSSTEATRGRDFGVHRALDTLGAAIGPLVAWAVLTLAPGSFRTVFLLSAIPGAVAIIVVLVFVREARRPARASVGTGPAFRLRHLGRPFAVFTAVSAVFALGNSSDALLMLRAADMGAPVAVVPLMGAAFSLVGALVAVPAGRLSDRLGRRSIIAVGFGLYALVYAGFALGGGAWRAALLFAAYGVPYGMVEGLTRAYVVDLVGPAVRATAVGGYTFVLGLAALPSSALAGLLWDRISPSAPFVVSAALMAVAAAGLAFAPGLARPPR